MRIIEGNVAKCDFAEIIHFKSMKVDTTAIEQEITAHEKQLRQSLTVWFTINRRNMHNRCAAVSWSSMCKECRNIG